MSVHHGRCRVVVAGGGMTSWLTGLVLTTGTLLVTFAAHGADDLEWAEPLSIVLPAPAREIELKPGVVVDAFVKRYGLAGATALRLGPTGTLLEAPVVEQRWAELKATACRDDAVRGCRDAQCQSIQLAARVEPGAGRSAASLTGRIVRRAGEQQLSLAVDAQDDGDAAAGQCRGEPAALLLDQPDNGGLGQDLVLDIDLRDRAAGRSRERAYEVDLTQQFNASGGADLGTSQVPADGSDYELKLAVGCAMVTVPLDSVEPAFVPGVVTALVDAGAVAAVAAQNGLALIREVALESTGEALAVYATSSDLPGALIRLARDSRVRLAQRDFVYRTAADVDYTDPFARFTYGPTRTGARSLHHAVGLGASAAPPIAVIDAGVDGLHPELADRVEVRDATGDGLVASAHGTAVAGIIAAAANNGVGIYGAAPAARVLAIQACLPREPGSVSARCRTSTLLKALDIAMMADSRIINMSLAGPPDPLLARFLRLAVTQDRLVIAGAGNGGAHAKPGYPAAHGGVLAVTATDVLDQHYGAANRGDYVELAAPGVDILSPTPDGRYPPLSGTSMATAQVAGVAALLLERDPTLSASALRAALTESARDLGAPGRDRLFGFGLVDACAAARRLALTDLGSCAAERLNDSVAVPILESARAGDE